MRHWLDSLRTPLGRVREAMVSFAVATTSRHLEAYREVVVRRWRASLQRRVARYAEHPDLSDRWGKQTVDLLVQVMRARGEVERLEARDRVFEHAHRVASEQLELGFSLEEILQALSLLRSSLSAQVQVMLSRRLWVAFPPDVMLATERVHEAIDLQMLAIGQAYLEARDRVIREKQRDLEESNEKLRTLLREMHHRIKNNLQTLADLLYLEALEAGGAARKSLLDSIGRVKSIAAVHQMLSADRIEAVEVRRLAERIGEIIGRDLVRAGRAVRVEIQGPEVWLPSKQATALALVLSELIHNALEHAFPDGRGRVVVHLGQVGQEVWVRVRDDGVGLPPDFSVERHGHLGLRIVRDLVSRDLRGTFSLRSEGGAVAEVHFQVPGAGEEVGPAVGEVTA
ncbi:MAG: sensor histidine kinase [Armatimonadota bacterium]|nr:sensor histidine kinase [Armatimonadota bacterium]MDR7412139.1 sensor histidine kinase [Armatimonadota bacterium]